MDKILLPIDRSITGLARFLAQKPYVSSISLVAITAILITTISLKPLNNFKTVDLSLPPDVLTSNLNNDTIDNTDITAAVVGHAQGISDLTAGIWHTVIVKRGENLAHIFKKLHLSPKELQAIMLAKEATARLTHLKPGLTLRFLLDSNNQLQQLIYQPNASQQLTIIRTAAGFTTQNISNIGSLPSTAGIDKNHSTSIPSMIASNPTTLISNQLSAAPVTANPDNDHWQVITIQRGGSLSSILHQLKLPAAELIAIAKANHKHHLLRKIKPGQLLGAIIVENHLQKLAYNVDSSKSVVITREGDNFKLKISKTSFNFTKPQSTISSSQTISSVASQSSATTSSLNEKPVKQASLAPPTYGFVRGVIHRSLYHDARNAGLTNKQATQLVNAFNQDKAIASDICSGDRFSVIYQKSSASHIRVGDILAMEIITKNKTYRLVRFVDSKGRSAFYTPNGMNLQPPIERAPVQYRYISSYFSEHRWHPILGFFRPHYGVDYAAPYGSLIHAAGDGKIIFEGWKGGYGNCIEIKHDAIYTTLYGHMARYASNIHNGSYVHKGEVIGYVGSTGLATGPHLHFEIHVDNSPCNPLTVALPSGTSLPWQSRHEFYKETRPWIAELNMHPLIKMVTNKYYKQA